MQRPSENVISRIALGVYMPWLALLLIGLAATPSWAQSNVRLLVSRDNAYVDESFTISLQVSDFQACDLPQAPVVPDCSIRLLDNTSESSYISIINGRQSASLTRTYMFEVVPHVIGELIIPPIKVQVDGRVLATQAAKVQVKSSDADELFAVDIECARKRIFVGQRVRLTMTIWVKPQRVQGQRLGIRDMLRYIRPINFGPFPTDNVKTGSQRLTDPDGTAQVYYTYQTWTDYVPDRPGRLNLDDLVVGIQYPMELSRDLFGSWQVQSARNLRARPKVAEVEILPLPDNGRPSNFTGAVGTFGLIVTATPTSVRVGDPIELRIDIRGDGPIETLPPPNLAADPLLARDFRVPDEDLPGVVSGSHKRFTATIRAQHAGIEEIPPIEYPYFDPDREMYVVALGDAIPLTVAPAAQLDAGTLAEMSGITTEPDAPQLRALDGLRANETRETVLLRSSTTVSLPLLATGTFAPPAVFLLAWGYCYIARTQTPGRRRKQNAMRYARRRLDRARDLPPAEAATEVAAAIAGYLADRQNEPEARFAGRAGLDYLRQRTVSEQVLADCNDVVERCEQASFGGMTDGDCVALADQADRCLRALEKERV
ncbi:MAG: BatD family protein [Planctomycetota bacterium]